MIEGCFKPKLKRFRVPVLYKKETVFHISRNGIKFSDFTIIMHFAYLFMLFLKQKL